jgi:hypothetical protein
VLAAILHTNFHFVLSIEVKALYKLPHTSLMNIAVSCYKIVELVVVAAPNTPTLPSV